jgi:hypothetical protein
MVFSQNLAEKQALAKEVNYPFQLTKCGQKCLVSDKVQILTICCYFCSRIPNAG